MALMGSSPQSEFQMGYKAAMEEVYNLLNSSQSKLNAYDNTLEWVKDALNK